MARKTTTRFGKLSMIAGGVAAASALGGIAYMMMRSRRQPSGASSLDTLPPNPAEDRFGNRGEDNMVEPLTLREDQILMRDRMNPYDSLY